MLCIPRRGTGESLLRTITAAPSPMRRFHHVLSLCACLLVSSCTNPGWHSLRVCNFSPQQVYITSINGVECGEKEKALFLSGTGYAPETTCEHSNIQNLQMTFPMVVQWKSGEDNFTKTRTSRITSHKTFISEGNDVHWNLVLYKNEWKVLKQCYSAEPAYSTYMVMYEVLGIPLPENCRQQSMLELLEGHYHLVETEEGQ